MGDEVVRQTRGTARYSQTVVTRKRQSSLHELVELVTESSIAAVDRCGSNPFGIERD